MHLMFDLSKLAYHPVMIQELMDVHGIIQKEIETEKENKIKQRGQEDLNVCPKAFVGRLQACHLVAQSGPSSILKELSTLLPKLTTGHRSVSCRRRCMCVWRRY